MYTLIIVGILGGFISYLYANQGNPFNWGMFIGGLFKTALVYGAVILMGRLCYIDENDLNTQEYRDLKIVSFANKDGWSVGGAFVLGTGSMSGSSYTYYVTYGKFSQGVKRLELSTDRYYLKETNSHSPCIPNYWEIDIKKDFKSKWWWNRNYTRSKYMDKNYSAKTIVVPTNTIFKHFEVKD